jgi:hypothetical protein
MEVTCSSETSIDLDFGASCLANGCKESSNCLSPSVDRDGVSAVLISLEHIS